MPKTKTPSEPESEPADEHDGYTLTIVYTSSQLTPPEHTVALRTSQSDWGDVAMTWTGDAWQAELRTTQDEGPMDIEFKFVLDGEQWMAGGNQQGRTEQPGSVLHYDDSDVYFGP